MFTLRCTRKLLDRLNAVGDSEPASSDTVLGDWYANLVYVGRSQFVVAVSERTLLPVVVPAKDGGSLVRRISEALAPMLAAIGIPTDAITAERDAMQHWVIGKTASRSIVGSLNDLVYQLQIGLTHFPDRTLLAHSLWLANTPMGAIGLESPDRATIAAFAASRALRSGLSPGPTSSAGSA